MVMDSSVSSKIKVRKVAIVFVHLGKNPSPNLIASAKYARRTNPEARIILLTDRTRNWEQFPGEVVKTHKRRMRQSRHLTRKAHYLKKIAGGYWVKTYDRLFVLQQLNRILDLETQIVHLESDVIIQDAHILINSLKCLNLNKFGVPRVSDNLGIASILISKNYFELEAGLTELENLSKEFPQICTNDMKLLGLALNKGVISELPSLYNQLEFNDDLKENYLFDGAAVGQYLFGRDPIHTSNIRVSGYENPDFPISLSSLKWGVEGNAVYATNFKTKYWFVNIHVHSKEELNLPDSDPHRWGKVLGEANLNIPRSPSGLVPEIIHSKGYSIQVRLEIYIREKLRVSKFGKNQE